MFRISCPYCGCRLRVSEEYAGRAGRCTRCRESLVVPQPDADPTVTVRALRPEEPYAEEVAASAEAVVPPTVTTLRALWSSRAEYGTAVDFVSAGAIGLAATVALYACLLPLKQYYFAQLFLKSEIIGVVIMLLCFWALGALALKYRQIKRQIRAFSEDILPITISLHVNADNVDEFIDNIDKTDSRVKQTFLLNRVRHALEHFKSRGQPQEVYNYVNSQSDIDVGIVSSSYSMIKVFIWAIPILGFIGTVVGIGQSVAQFHAGLAEVQNIDAVRDYLGNVVSGLSVAFNTTLLGLGSSLLVMFPATALQRTEDRILHSVESYCNEKVLRRLQERAEGAEQPGEPAAAPGIDDRAAERMERAAAALADGLQHRCEDLAEQFAKLNEGTLQQTVKLQFEISARHKEMVERLAEIEGQLTRAFAQVTDDLPEQSRALRECLERACGELGTAVQRAEEHMAGQYAKLQEGYVASTAELTKTTAAVAESFGSIEDGLRGFVGQLQQVAEGQRELTGLLQDGQSGGQLLSNLNGTLEQLRDKLDELAVSRTVTLDHEPILEPVTLPRKRSFFGLFRRQ